MSSEMSLASKAEVLRDMLVSKGFECIEFVLERHIDGSSKHWYIVDLIDMNESSAGTFTIEGKTAAFLLDSKDIYGIGGSFKESFNPIDIDACKVLVEALLDEKRTACIDDDGDTWLLWRADGAVPLDGLTWEQLAIEVDLKKEAVEVE